MKKYLLLFSTVLLFAGLLGCEETSTDITTPSSARVAASRMITTTLYAFAPQNYIDVYNGTSSKMTVAFSYNMGTSSSGWVSAGTKTVSARNDASYCRIGAKQIRAVVTYDVNAGSTTSFTWQKYSCN